jgi:endoglucanase
MNELQDAGEFGEIVEVVSRLCRLPGPSGHEDRVRAEVVRSWSELALTPTIDRVGNVLARVGGEGPRVLLQAHMDEIGYVVRHIDADGFLFLDSGQGERRDAPDGRLAVGREALVLGRGEVVARGTFVTPAGHIIAESELSKPLTLAKYFVDIGAESRAEVEAMGVHIGSPVVWDSSTRVHGRRIVSKALDDRLMLGAIELLLRVLDRGRLNCDLWVAATVQEENALHGARALAATERFDAVLALDNALSGDVPTIDKTDVDNRLTAGPVVVHQDLAVAYDQSLAWHVIDTGRANRISVQQAVYTNYATDGVPFMDAGSPAVVLGPPTRYTHTANEMADLRDVRDAIALMEAVVSSPASFPVRRQVADTP